MSRQQAVVREKSFDGASFVVAVVAVVVAVWSGYEAHSARIEAREAIGAAERSAAAAEKSNKLAARSQSSYLIPSILQSGNQATVKVKNVSNNIALNIRSGYFLYTGPLKSVDDVSTQLSNTSLRPLVLALGASGETTVVDSLVSPTEASQDVNVSFSVPVVKMDSPLAPRIEMQTQTVKIGTARVPEKTLVIGLVSFEDGLNVQHRATFCFPLNSGSEDQECAKLNSLQLSNAGEEQPMKRNEGAR
jgi:hypothetical protein